VYYFRIRAETVCLSGRDLPSHQRLSTRIRQGSNERLALPIGLWFNAALHSWRSRIPYRKRTGRAELKQIRQTPPLVDRENSPRRASCGMFSVR
jgi:hypothetical protein